MTYATQQDLIDRFGEAQLKQVADRDGDDGLDPDVVAKALADADAEIDGYIGVRYELPLASTPARLVTIACDIAFYRLHPAGVPEDVRQRYYDARSFLLDVAKGLALLDVAGDEPDDAGDGVVQHTGPARAFSRDSLKGF
jgi:phage gp36-like protein